MAVAGGGEDVAEGLEGTEEEVKEGILRGFGTSDGDDGDEEEPVEEGEEGEEGEEDAEDGTGPPRAICWRVKVTGGETGTGGPIGAGAGEGEEAAGFFAGERVGDFFGGEPDESEEDDP